MQVLSQWLWIFAAVYILFHYQIKFCSQFEIWKLWLFCLPSCCPDVFLTLTHFWVLPVISENAELFFSPFVLFYSWSTKKLKGSWVNYSEFLQNGPCLCWILDLFLFPDCPLASVHCQQRCWMSREKTPLKRAKVQTERQEQWWWCKCRVSTRRHSLRPIL